MKDKLQEDAGAMGASAIANSVGAERVDGIGVGPRGEPGVSKKKNKSPVMNFKDYLRRVTPK